MKTLLYPNLGEVLELHRVLVERFGGTGGVRDKGLLESALMRPQSGYYATLSLQAAAVLQSLAQNHCFVDGNKRVAFAVMAIILRMNGVRILVEAAEGEQFIIEVLIGQRADLEKIVAWLEPRMKPLR